MNFTRAFRGPRKESVLIGLIRGCFGIEAFATGCAGVIALLTGLFFAVAILVSGLQYVPVMAITIVIGLALIAGSGGLVWVGVRLLSAHLSRSWMIAVPLQAALTAVGTAVAVSIAPDLDGPTQGPFADGQLGAIGLMAYAYAGCGLLSLLLFAVSALNQKRPALRSK